MFGKNYNDTSFVHIEKIMKLKKVLEMASLKPLIPFPIIKVISTHLLHMFVCTGKIIQYYHKVTKCILLEEKKVISNV